MSPADKQCCVVSLGKRYNYDCKVIDPRGWTLKGVPVLGGILDLAENYMHINLLEGVKSLDTLGEISSELVGLSFAFTILMWSLTVGSLGIAILLRVYRRFLKTHQPRESAELAK